MKKFFVLFIVCFSLLTVSCYRQKFVKYMEVTNQSWGIQIDFATFGTDNSMTSYTLMIPDSDVRKESTLYIKKFPPHSVEKAESVQKFENVKVGERYSENGKLKSIVINNIKYVNR